ncbi:hypothetical protein [Morganella sp. GD04133]|uniref:hypothetical protein n=1 Tax=Morganella TaxID=581 RepID=UPI00244ABB5F|nr:hypothetical protein [Morganella sp. GD04133]MDH0353514.1 hypothetical protein [Morganella sp. GD04133]
MDGKENCVTCNKLSDDEITNRNSTRGGTYTVINFSSTKLSSVRVDFKVKGFKDNSKTFYNLQKMTGTDTHDVKYEIGLGSPSNYWEITIERNNVKYFGKIKCDFRSWDDRFLILYIDQYNTVYFLFTDSGTCSLKLNQKTN